MHDPLPQGEKDTSVPTWALCAGISGESSLLLQVLHLLYTEVEDDERIVPPISDSMLAVLYSAGARKEPSKSSLRRWREELEAKDTIKVEDISVPTATGRRVLRKYRLRVQPGPSHLIRSASQMFRLIEEARERNIPEDEFVDFVRARAREELGQA